MEKLISEICNSDMKKAAFKNAQFIMIAESGAMGEAGAVYIMTQGGSIFHCNYVYGDVKLAKLFRSVPVLKEWNEGLYDDNSSTNGWNFVYLGAGNNLFIREDAYDEFFDIMGTDKNPSELFATWLSVAWQIIEKKNKGKLPFETKTKEELQLVMRVQERDTETHGVGKLNEEERVMEDMEAGYDPYEDERVIVTQELVHGDDIPSCLRVNEGFFSDGRSYLSEMWCYELITNVTYYFLANDPLSGVISNDEKLLEEYLIEQKKIIAGEEHSFGIMELNTNVGRVYSVTVSVGCDDEMFCEAYM